MVQSLECRPLIGMELAELTAALGGDQPGFRARQLFDALYRQQVTDLGQISSLPQAVRNQLLTEFNPGLPEIEQAFQSSDGTRRYLLRLADSRTVETVLMPEEHRDTICISSQVGCPVDCKFCLTALMGLERNLTAGEIVGQVLLVMREHGLNGAATEGSGRLRANNSRLNAAGSRLNIVLMGMGEPLLNLDAVLKATRLLCDPEGIAISPRRITLSTSGIIPQIEELGRAAVRPKLAVSLNASTEEQRRELMPITRKYHLRELIEACRRYPLRPWEKLSFEYVLLGGVNDSDADARRVAGMLGNLNCKVNLIALNPGPGIPFATPSAERVASFQSILRKSFPCFLRKPRGRDIFAACGQLKRVSNELLQVG
jgi:23S rRNA (adenine2503-C2)-methyltransferase